MAKLYKFQGKKLDEQQLRQVLNENLDSLIGTADAFMQTFDTEEVQIFIREHENDDFKSGLMKKLVEIMNSQWEKKMKPLREKSAAAISKNNLLFIAKDVSSGVKSLPKLISSMQEFISEAETSAATGDGRYACKIFKFVQKAMTESKEYYLNQQDYNQSYLPKTEKEAAKTKEKYSETEQ